MSRPFSRVVLVCMAMTVAGAGCESLPEASLRQNTMRATTEIRGDSLRITILNPAPIPNQVDIGSSIPAIEARIASRHEIGPAGETVVALDIAGLDTTGLRANLELSFTMGSPAMPVRPVPLAWPFPRGRTYRIIQEYGGSFSHTSTYSRYALDFSLAEGDTVSAADDGYVVGVIEGYTIGGNDPKYRPYANFITLFHPHSGLLTQYVHLAPEGSFVAVGDTVSRGTPLGLAGLTGFTSVQHLHFNVLVADSTEGVVSFPILFEDGTDGRTLKRGDRVGH